MALLGIRRIDKLMAASKRKQVKRTRTQKRRTDKPTASDHQRCRDEIERQYPGHLERNKNKRSGQKPWYDENALDGDGPGSV